MLCFCVLCKPATTNGTKKFNLKKIQKNKKKTSPQIIAKIPSTNLIKSLIFNLIVQIWRKKMNETFMILFCVVEYVMFIYVSGRNVE